MRLPQPQPRAQEENLIPLINIVFLLLIFFMVAGTLARPDLLRVEPPQSSAEAVPDQEGLALLLAGDGRLALDNEFVADEELPARLREALRETPERRLQLKADAQVPARRLHEVMALLREAGVEKIRLLTVQG